MNRILLLIISAIFIFGCATSSIENRFVVNGDHGKLSAILQTPSKKKTIL